MLRRLLVCLAVAASPAVHAATQGGPIPVPLPLFPANNWWNTDISRAPVDANSAAFISHIGTTVHVHPDWGGDVTTGDHCDIYGFPFIIVDGTQPLKTVTFFGAPDESDGVGVPFYPIPDEAASQCAWIEGGQAGNNPTASGDRHMLIVDKTHNTLFELGNVSFDGANWNAYSGAFFDMNTNNRRPDTWTSADAAGLAILPGLVRYDEVYGANEITHAFRFTVQNSNSYVFPASHSAGTTAGALPMGARLRLKSSTNISTYPADVQKIMRALMKYGIIVADNGSNMYIQGSYDNRWDMGVMNTYMSKLTANDFEVVQLGWKPAASFILALPANMGSGDTADATLTVYDANYNVNTGYRGTVHFTSTDGAATLPVDYTFTAGDNGVHTFPAAFILRTLGGQTVFATDTVDPTITASKIVIVGPPAPTGLAATANTTTSVTLTWNASSGATQYQIARASAGVAYTTIGTTSATTFPDTVAAGATYVYKVLAVDGFARVSPYSTPDAVTTVTFTDDPLIAFGTVIQAVHINEIRAAINLMRAAAGLTAFSFTNSNPSGVTVQAIHVQEMRIALTQARTALGLPAVTFTDATITGGTTIVKAAHFQQLRDAVK